MRLFHVQPESPLTALEGARLARTLRCATEAIHEAKRRGAPIPEHGIVLLTANISSEQWTPADVLDELEVRQVALEVDGER